MGRRRPTFTFIFGVRQRRWQTKGSARIAKGLPSYRVAMEGITKIEATAGENTGERGMTKDIPRRHVWENLPKRSRFGGS